MWLKALKTLWTCRPSVLIDDCVFSLQHNLHVSLVKSVVFLHFKRVWTIVDMSSLISYRNETATCRNRIVLSINHDLLIVLSSHLVFRCKFGFSFHLVVLSGVNELANSTSAKIREVLNLCFRVYGEKTSLSIYRSNIYVVYIY